VLFPVLLRGDFQSPFLVFFLGCFRDLSLRDLMGKFVGTLRGSLGCDSSPESVSKGARFWGFPSSRVRGVLGRISSIPPFSTSFGGVKLGYGLPMRYSYYPQSLVQVRGAIREIEVWIWGVDPRVLFIPSCLGYTGLTGALDRSDRCNPWWVFARVNVWVSLLLSCVGTVSSLGLFGGRLACLAIWGLSGLDRSDRCVAPV
jgi:hypothetical protein